MRAQLAMEGQAQAPPVGALIFSCNGRGVGLFGEPDFDSRTLASFLPVPSSGFFCNGALAKKVAGMSEAASVQAGPMSGQSPVIACCRAPSDICLHSYNMKLGHILLCIVWRVWSGGGSQRQHAAACSMGVCAASLCLSSSELQIKMCCVQARSARSARQRTCMASRPLLASCASTKALARLCHCLRAPAPNAMVSL